VRILKLEVENFRAMRAASVSFGSGLNVVHGPNDLGKSTLAEAVRAALLVPTKSKEGKSYIRWDDSAPARVSLTFESGGKLCRVRKTFGSGFQSVLERSDSLDPARFREIAHGGGVEGMLRELLCWGISPPGGKGAPTKATSYLVTALLGRQGEVQSILNASLADDKDDTGRALVTNALGVLGKDPLVVRLVERLSERVDGIFTPGEKFKKTADSPLVKLQEHLKVQEDHLRDLTDADSKGKAIEKSVVALQAERLQLLAKKQVAEANWAAAKEREERATRKAGLQDVIDGCKNELDGADRLVSELNSLQTRLTKEEAERNRLKTEEAVAASTLEATQRLTQTASEEVVRATGAVAQSAQLTEATHQQRRAELDGKKASADARLKDIESAEKAVSDRSALERDLQSATEAATTASAAITDAQRVLEHATLSEKLQELTERQDTADRLSAKYEDAQRREEEAVRRLRAAETALADAVARRDRRELDANAPEIKEPEAQLKLLRAVEMRIRVQSLHDQVRELEAQDARGRECLNRAVTRRSTASQLEQEIAGRVLPTKEQIASWRALETEVGSEPGPAAPVRRSLLVPVAAGIGAGLAAALTARFAMAWSGTAAIVAGIAIAIMVAASIWAVTRSKVGSDAQDHERRRRLSERWTLEILPSLRASGLPNLAAYESALANMEQRRTEAQKLRLEAEQDDLQAAAAAQAAASLESRRVELAGLEGQESIEDSAALAAGLEEFGNNLPALRRRIDDGQRRLDALRISLRQAADDAVREATARVKEQRSEYDVLVKETASVRAEFEIARQRCDTHGVDQARFRLEPLGSVGGPAVSVEVSMSQLERAKNEAANASARVSVLHAQLDAMRPKVGQIVSALADNLPDARQKVERQLAEIEAEWKTLESIPLRAAASASETLTNAKQKHAELEKTLDADRRALEAATAALSEADRTVASVKTDVASKQGELKAIDRAALESKRQAALNDSVFQVPESDGMALGAASDAFEGLKRKLEECDSRLNAAKGQLHLIAGHVGSERLAQQEEAVRYAREEVLDRERTEMAALRLLNEIRSVESARTSHLGRTLAGPITETFRALTDGRYGQIELDPDLRTHDIAALGAPREVSDLSVGTREQLATLIRLAIAAHLQTALVLDDQLVHSDSARLNWFRERLRSSVREHCHQVIVFTCRPGDYLSADAQAEEDSVVVVDLVAQLAE
jgi:DNA repair exonuclease SbcCD ATPase subunit